MQGCDVIACSASQDGGFTGDHPGTAVEQNFPIPTGADPLHWHFFRTRAGENNVYLAFANVLNASAAGSGYSGVFGPDTFAFPRHEALLLDGMDVATLTIDTRSVSGSAYPTNLVRRKDLVLMRLPHHYKALVFAAGPADGIPPNGKVSLLAE